MSNFVLKIIACICMFIGHIPFAVPSLAIPCIYIGKLAFPIFAFLISEGYTHTKSFGKYLKRLLILALISQIPAYALFMNDFSTLYLNIFFTLSLGLLSIRFWDKIKKKYLAIFLVFALAIVAELTGCDFGAIGVLMIFIFHAFKNKKNIMVLLESGLMIFLFLEKFTHYTTYTVSIIRYLLFQLLFTVLSLLFILFYNGKLGKSNKAIQRSFYLFYPLHLILLCLIKYF